MEKNFPSLKNCHLLSIHGNLSFQSHPQIVGSKSLPAAIKAANQLIIEGLSQAEYNDPRFAFSVYVVPRTTNNKNKAHQSVIYAPPGSAVEVAVRQVELPKYTAKQIVQMMNEEGYPEFTIHGKGRFVEFWKSKNGKKLGNGDGVQISMQWFWYDRMVTELREFLKTRAAVPKAA